MLKILWFFFFFFWFDIVYVNFDSLYCVQIRDNISNNINEFLHGISTDLVPVDYLASNTLEDPMLGKENGNHLQWWNLIFPTRSIYDDIYWGITHAHDYLEMLNPLLILWTAYDICDKEFLNCLQLREMWRYIEYRK